jgi:heme oxygenase
MEGRLSRDLFARHLLALQGVYEALEAALERLGHDPRIGAFCLPALWRRASIEADLDFLRGSTWRREAPVEGGVAYADHIRRIAATEPIRLVSHAYVRYLGDLSGGQMLKKMAARQLGLDGHGLSFYEFPAIGDPATFKADFRRRLDDLRLEDGEREGLLDEARTAFHLNAAIFNQLV